MSASAPTRVQGGVRSRLHCWREGHYWERQVDEEGDNAHQVCVRCGKLGEELPVLNGEHAQTQAGEPEVVAAEAAPEIAAEDQEEARGRRIDTRTAVLVVAGAVVLGGAIFALRRRRH